MSRKQAILLAMAVLLAGLIALLQLNPQADPPQEAQPQSIPITDEHVAGLSAIVLVNEKGMTALYADGSEIKMMDGEEGVSLSDTMLKAWYYQMAHLEASRVLGQPESWAPYGLEDYLSALVLMKKDGGRIRVFLGDESPLGGGRYVRVEGDPRLYLLDGLGMEMMLYGLDDFRDVDVLPSISSDKVSQITRLSIGRADGTLKISSIRQDGAVLFVLESPFEAALNWQQVTDRLILPLASLQSAQFVSDDVPLAEYGFYGPDAIRVELEMEGDRRVLLFAPSQDDAYLYCAREGNGNVILVRRADTDFLQLTGYDLMDSTLYTQNAADVDSVTLSTDTLHGVLELTGQGESLRGSIGGRTLDQAETVALYKSLTLLPPAQTLEEGTDLAGDSMLTLVICRKDGAEDTVQCIPITERRCAVLINGSASFTTYTASVQEIIRVAHAAFGDE